jgi:glycosyltransferase involved in cell wall biosynthesis
MRVVPKCDLDSMKILYVTELFPDPEGGYGLWGGGERQFFEQAKGMAKLGHEVTVLTCRFPGQPSADSMENLRIIREGTTRDPNTGTALKSPLKVGGYLARTVRAALAVKADIIHCNAYYPIIAGRIVSSVKSLPMVSTIHDLPRPSAWSSYANSELWGLAGYAITLASIWSAQGVVVTVSKQSKLKLFKRGVKRIEVIPNGVDLDLIDTTGGERRQNQILYVGRLVRYKRVDTLVEALKVVHDTRPGTRLVVVGDGPEYPSLKGLALRLGLSDSVEFTGTLRDNKDVARLYNESTIFVSPSLVEGEGIALKEAMASRLPVVAADVQGSGVHDIVKGGWNGLLFEPGNPRRLADCILSLLSNPGTRQELGNNGRRSVEKDSWEMVTKSLVEVYEGLLNQ